MIGTVHSPGNQNFIHVFVTPEEISLLEKGILEGDYKGLDGTNGNLKLSVDNSKCSEMAEYEYHFKDKENYIIDGIDIVMRSNTYWGLVNRRVVAPHLGYAHIYIYNTSEIKGTREEWFYERLKK